MYKNYGMSVDDIRLTAAGERSGGNNGGFFSVDGASTAPFKTDDIETVVAYDDRGDYWDGLVVAIVRLKDGRYVGWDTFWGPTGNGFCEDAYGGDAEVHFANDLERLIRFGLSEDARDRLGISLEGM